MPDMCFHLRRLIVLCLCTAAVTGCAATTDQPQARRSPAILQPEAADVVIRTEPWTFRGTPGRMILTPSYRLFTTETDELLLKRLPVFLEMSLRRYTSEFGPLPKPPMVLDTFVMANREQWMALTRQVMGEHAQTYLLIDRGGFSSGGRALLWNIGRYDTFAIAAHEGWHQYTQRTFKDELPEWLEEGIGVYMEGMVATRGRELEPRPAGWANLERYDQLYRAAKRGELMPLAVLLEAHPEDLIHTSTDAALTYYAQAWALVKFLRNFEGGLHRSSLHRLLADAAQGRLRTEAGGGEAPSGTQVFRIYFDDDLVQADRTFSHFVMDLMQPGVRERVARGEHPFGSRTD